MPKQRPYTDVGFISKDASLNVLGDDGKFSLLIPIVNIPEHRGAPETADKTVLSDHTLTYTEALQSVDQKTYTFNYHRDNIIQLEKYRGKNLTFLERNPDNTGERYTGTLTYGRGSEDVNGIVQGNLFITVTSADESPIIDCRDLIKQTAIIETPLSDIDLATGGTYSMAIQTVPASATVKATSASESIATVNYADGKLTVTAVAKGNTLIKLETSATGEASSYRTIAVSVDTAE